MPALSAEVQPGLECSCGRAAIPSSGKHRLGHRRRRAGQRIRAARRPSGTRSPGGCPARRPSARRTARCPSRSRRAAARPSRAPRAGSRTSRAPPRRRGPSCGRRAAAARRRGCGSSPSRAPSRSRSGRSAGPARPPGSPRPRSPDLRIGAVNGWCRNVQRPVSSSCSKSGKSITQWKTSLRCRPGRARVRGARAGHRARARRSPRRPRANRTVEPGSARNAASSASERNFAIGERTSPLSSTTMYARPLAPHSFATSSSRASSAREKALRRDDEADARDVGEHAELRAARHLGRVLDLEPEAKVRLVGAVARDRVAVGEPRERPRRRLTAERLERRRRPPPPSRRARPRARRTRARGRAGGTRTAGRRADPRRASRWRSGSSGRARRPCRAA